MPEYVFGLFPLVDEIGDHRQLESLVLESFHDADDVNDENGKRQEGRDCTSQYHSNPRYEREYAQCNVEGNPGNH